MVKGAISLPLLRGQGGGMVLLVRPRLPPLPERFNIQYEKAEAGMR